MYDNGTTLHSALCIVIILVLTTATVQMDELCRLLTNVCTVVPNGVVCFVSSFGYLEQVSSRY
jgi:hypothetical protein